MEKKDINTVENEENVNPQQDNTNATQDNVAETDTPKSDNEAEAQTETVTEADPLDVALGEIEELKKQKLYLQAEFDNYRKRTMKEKADLILMGGEKVVTSFLPVLDDFERAMAANAKAEDVEAVKEGMLLIFNKFVKTLEQQGVKKIETEGADFDTDFHEAIAQVPGMGDDKKNKVIDCVQTGYTMGDKVIRHAKVAVGA